MDHQEDAARSRPTLSFFLYFFTSSKLRRESKDAVLELPGRHTFRRPAPTPGGRVGCATRLASSAERTVAATVSSRPSVAWCDDLTWPLDANLFRTASCNCIGGKKR